MTCTVFVDDGTKCGQPSSYEMYADHLGDCWPDDTPDSEALCTEHASELRAKLAAQTTVVICKRCGMPYYRIRTRPTIESETQ